VLARSIRTPNYKIAEPASGFAVVDGRKQAFPFSCPFPGWFCVNLKLLGRVPIAGGFKVVRFKRFPKRPW
jgi:hypothetical protein